MKDLNKLAILISKPEHFEYFFKKVNDPDLFDWLDKEVGAFDHIPGPILSEDGKSERFPNWWPAQYLAKISDKIPDKVLLVLKRIKTNNYFAIDDSAQAILNMPADFLLKNSKEIIHLFDNWLDIKYPRLIQQRASNLFRKYIDLNSFDDALNLLNILSKLLIKECKKPRFDMEIFHFNELIKNTMPKLIENVPAKLIKVIEIHLRDALEKEYKRKENDLSELWRPSIENSSQNWGRDDPKEMFVQLIRDSLEELSKIYPSRASTISRKWLKDKFSIFQRIAIHCARISDRQIDLAKKIIMEKERLFRGRPGYHEFLLLLKDRFKEISEENKLEFLKWVEEGPHKDNFEGFEQYKKREQLRILIIISDIIKESAKTKKEFAYYLELLDKLNIEKLEPENLTFTHPHTSWVGPVSLLTKEEIMKMTPGQFVDWIKDNLQPPFEMMGPSPEGVARIFQEVVKEKYIEYANAADKFLDDKIWPTYLCGYIRGLGGAIEGGGSFNLEPILKFIENPLKFHEELKIGSQHDTFDIGQYSWFRGTIYNFIEALVSGGKIPLNADIMNRTRKLLMDSIIREEDPTEADEKRYGPDAQNMDYVTYCINSNRGKALHALIQHALCFARMSSEDEKKKEVGKGPFPPGERMNLYKKFLTEHLIKEKSASVQSSYGQFLPFLFYLDQEWVKKMKENDMLFPKAKERNNVWEAHWQGYLFNNFYDQLYKLLDEDYKKAVDNLAQESDKKKSFHENEVLIQHLIIAFWRGIECLKEDEMINAFFRNAPVELRCSAIRFLGDGLKENKLSKDSDEWARCKDLWKDRLKKAKDVELANFVTWLKYTPDNLDDLVELIIPIVPYLYMGYQEEDLLEYINEKVEINTKNSLLLLDELFKVKQSLVNIHFRLPLIKEILTKAGKYKDIPEVPKYINQSVNRLGEMGYYDFKDLLIK